ncbi:hypothetical protein SELMODRAFT_106795 [Selaginella moellendorffii]|uniref:EF-hand domain-containing protein n=2 Tax=Selaginella moellendorffii TaxID=88036 RepID=D8S1Z4_SELML|nr:hypothetical protein SELMODRAFT_106795 [Selaginella moellendorffii]
MLARLIVLVLLVLALGAGSSSHGEGSHAEMTPLQKHVAFFDRNGDGIVYPWETYTGFRALGFNVPTSFFAMVAINGALSYPTLESWIPSPRFPIYVKNIHRAKHGSDTGVYDHEGRFVPAHFEQLFAKFAGTHQDKLSLKEIMAMTRSNRDALDFFGWYARSAAKLEWGAAFQLVKDENGYASKQSIKGIYDGSLFYDVEIHLKTKRNKI